MERKSGYPCMGSISAVKRKNKEARQVRAFSCNKNFANAQIDIAGLGSVSAFSGSIQKTV
jgi:hypothetical protein